MSRNSSRTRVLPYKCPDRIFGPTRAYNPLHPVCAELNYVRCTIGLFPKRGVRNAPSNNRIILEDEKIIDRGVGKSLLHDSQSQSPFSGVAILTRQLKSRQWRTNSHQL